MSKKTQIIIASIFVAVAGILFYRQVFSANLTVTFLGSTNTQAYLQYTAPSGAACQIEVSNSPTYSPQINDASSTLFSLSNSDTDRMSTVASGTLRTLVIGKRTADLALDGNRYSRALQADTTYYYRITCGANVGTGSFATKTLPFGLTYSDVIPGDTNGSTTWPTLFNDRTQQIIDPQTGVLITRLSLAADAGGAYYPSYLNIGSSGDYDICNSTLVADNTGAMGYHCLVSGVLFWVNPTTGIGRPVGIPIVNDTNFNAQVCNSIDTSNPNRDYCVAADNITFAGAITSVQYSGQNTFATSTLPACNGSNQPCTTTTIITPTVSGHGIQNLMHSFDSSYPLNFNINGYPPALRSVQNGKLLLDQFYNIQDTYAWFSVFDPGNGVPVDQSSSTAAVIGLMSSYKNYPIRWCDDHTLTPIGNFDWMYISSNYLRGNVTTPGAGTYTNDIVAGNISSSTSACPVNPYGQTQCTTIVVDGEPCNATESPSNSGASCGIPGANYLQDAQPGDILGIDPITRGRTYHEFLQLISKSGNTWTVARGLNQTTIASHSTGVLDEACTSHDTVQANYDIGTWFWDYIHDPHGVGTPTGTPGSTIVYEKQSSGGHGGYRPSKYLDLITDPNPPFDTGYRIRNGDPLTVSTDPGTLLFDIDPKFAGTTGNAIPNTVDSHAAPFVNNQYAIDARPMLSGSGYSHTATSLGSNIYKYAVGAITLNRKQQPTIAFSNVNILRDISGVGSNIASSTDYTYCVVVNNGECYSGSLAGEVYAKVSSATQSTCPFYGVASDGWNVHSICIGDNSTYNQSILQLGANVKANGKNGRMLTHGLSTYGREDVFWNAKALPDNSNILFTLPNDPYYGNGAGQLFMAKIPSNTSDTALRDDFKSVPVNLTAPTGLSITQARVKFGYNEYNNSTSTIDYYCTSRKEACVKGAQSGTSYDFASSTFSNVSCTTNCTINIPAIPERIVYYQVEYLNAGNSVVATQSGVTSSEGQSTPPQPLYYQNGGVIIKSMGATIRMLGQ